VNSITYPSTTRNVLERIRPAISLAEFRELLECVAGVRVIRLDIPVASIDGALETASLLRLVAATGNEAYNLLIDSGFHTWSSQSEQVSTKRPTSLVSLYLGYRQEQVENAKRADASNDHDAFGALLSNFVRYAARFGLKEDPLLWIKWNTPSAISEHMFPNPISRYFGMGLVSYFPCSLNCTATSTKAKRTFDCIRSYSPGIARRFDVMEQSTALYAAGQGVVALSRYTPTEGGFSYSSRHATVRGSSELAVAVRKGHEIITDGFHNISIVRESQAIWSTVGEHVRVYKPIDFRLRHVSEEENG
jgi:hypothetical protein